MTTVSRINEITFDTLHLHLLPLLKSIGSQTRLERTTMAVKKYQLISATPSPYARKVRIALAEKGIDFDLKTEVPWDNTTKTPDYNPLEKLPVLIIDNGKAVYESHYIMEWLEEQYPDQVPLLPHGSTQEDRDARLFAKQVEVVCDGICDALVLCFFEKQRDSQSKPWVERQMRKVDGGLRQLAVWAKEKEGDFLVNDRFGLADIAAGSVCGYLSVRWPDHAWKKLHPELCEYWQKLEQRPSFKDTVPSPQTITDKIV